MVVDDFHVVAMAFVPDKTNSPLIVDSNGVLAFSVTAQSLQLIRRRRSQNAQFCRGVHLEQFSQGDSLEGAKALAAVVMEKLLSFLRAKAADHMWRILRYALYVKRRRGTMWDNSLCAKI